MGLDDLEKNGGGWIKYHANGPHPKIGDTLDLGGGKRAIVRKVESDTKLELKYNPNPRGDPGGGISLCFITTAVCKTLGRTDDCAELTLFRNFRDTFMQETPEMKAEVKEYYDIAPRICSAIDNAGESFANKKYSEIWKTALEPAFEALNHGDKQKAHDIYKGMVLGLKKEFLGGEKQT
jgi:hypothetical protein